MALGIPNIITGSPSAGTGISNSAQPNSRAQMINSGTKSIETSPKDTIITEDTQWSGASNSRAQNLNFGLSANPTQGSSSAGSLPPVEQLVDEQTDVEADAAADNSDGIGSDGDYSTPYNFGEYLSGLFASVGAENEINRTFNAYQAQANRDFQERMSNSAYTRAVRDLKNAGLNPVLAFSSAGSAASTPSGSQAYLNVSGGDTFSSVISSLANAASVIGQLLSFFGVGKNTVGSIGFK